MGAAFGLGTIKIVTLINIVILMTMIVFMIVNRHQIKKYFPVIVIIAGAIGNLIDRLFRGYVIDFIDIRLFDFPNFNIADILIVFGSIALLIIIFKVLVKTLDK